MRVDIDNEILVKREISQTNRNRGREMKEN